MYCFFSLLFVSISRSLTHSACHLLMWIISISFEHIFIRFVQNSDGMIFKTMNSINKWISEDNYVARNESMWPLNDYWVFNVHREMPFIIMVKWNGIKLKWAVLAARQWNALLLCGFIKFKWITLLWVLSLSHVWLPLDVLSDVIYVCFTWNSVWLCCAASFAFHFERVVYSFGYWVTRKWTFWPYILVGLTSLKTIRWPSYK